MYTKQSATWGSKEISKGVNVSIASSLGVELDNTYQIYVLLTRYVNCAKTQRLTRPVFAIHVENMNIYLVENHQETTFAAGCLRSKMPDQQYCVTL